MPSCVLSIALIFYQTISHKCQFGLAYTAHKHENPLKGHVGLCVVVILYPCPPELALSLRTGRGGSITCMWVVQTQETSVILSHWVVSLSTKLVAGHGNRTHDRLD
mgnify:CR=1 FL=1